MKTRGRSPCSELAVAQSGELVTDPAATGNSPEMFKRDSNGKVEFLFYWRCASEAVIVRLLPSCSTWHECDVGSAGAEGG